MDRGEKGPAVTVPSSIRRDRLEVREHWVGIFPEAVGREGTYKSSFTEQTR